MPGHSARQAVGGACRTGRVDGTHPRSPPAPVAGPRRAIAKPQSSPRAPSHADMRLKTPSAEDFHCSLQELLERGEQPCQLAACCVCPACAQTAGLCQAASAASAAGLRQIVRTCLLRPRSREAATAMPPLLCTACFLSRHAPALPTCRHTAPGHGGGAGGHHSGACVCQARTRPRAVLARAGVVVRDATLSARVPGPRTASLRACTRRPGRPLFHPARDCQPFRLGTEPPPAALAASPLYAPSLPCTPRQPHTPSAPTPTPPPTREPLVEERTGPVRVERVTFSADLEAIRRYFVGIIDSTTQNSGGSRALGGHLAALPAHLLPRSCPWRPPHAACGKLSRRSLLGCASRAPTRTTLRPVRGLSRPPAVRAVRHYVRAYLAERLEEARRVLQVGMWCTEGACHEWHEWHAWHEWQPQQGRGPPRARCRAAEQRADSWQDAPPAMPVAGVLAGAACEQPCGRCPPLQAYADQYTAAMMDSLEVARQGEAPTCTAPPPAPHPHPTPGCASVGRVAPRTAPVGRPFGAAVAHSVWSLHPGGSSAHMRVAPS